MSLTTPAEPQGATADFAEIQAEFDATVGDVVYATMTTVDQKGRPRARVLIPVWERPDGSPSGWLATYRTPVKEAHLANNPHTTFSYWSPHQNQVAIDAVGSWPSDPELRVLRLAPWRIQVIRGHDLRSRIWRARASA